MDLDVPLFWLALMLPAGALSRAAGTGWSLVCGGLLLAALAGETLAPGQAAVPVIALWALLIALPSTLARFAARAVAAQDYVRAHRLSLGVCLLHPLDGWPGQVALFRALSLLRAGRWDLARPRLERLAAPGVHGVNQLSALSYLCAWTNDWRPLADRPPPAPGDILAAIMRIRALGESGRTEDMLAQYAAIAPVLAHHPYRAMALLPVFAFSGRPRAVTLLNRTALPLLPAETKSLWLATARLAAGGPETGEGRIALETLARSPLADIRHLAETRLTAPPPRVGILSEDNRDLLDRSEAAFAFVPRAGEAVTWRHGPVTLAIMAVLLAVFAAEIVLGGSLGGSEDNEVLFRMGGLWPPAVFGDGEWWRLLTAPFLHAGPVHLVFNLFALWFLGLAAETMFGRTRFLILYGLTAVGSTACVLALMRFGWTEPGLLIGASGALMGLVGAIAGVLVTRLRETPNSGIGRRVWAIFLLLAVQTGMDLTTPHVSFSAHASGFAVGFLLGLMPWSRRGVRLPARAEQSVPPLSAGVTRRGFAVWAFLGGVFGVALWQRSGFSFSNPPSHPRRALAGPVVSGIRRLRFAVLDSEGGTPSVYPLAPFGSPDALADLRDLAGGGPGRDGARELYGAIMEDLPLFCARARLAPGHYALPSSVVGPLQGGVRPAREDFIFTAEHAALIPALSWRVPDMGKEKADARKPGQPWPVTMADPRRPYGGRTFFEADMAAALGLTAGRDEQGNPVLPPATIARLRRLHAGMTGALRLFVLHAKLPPEREDTGRR